MRIRWLRFLEAVSNGIFTYTYTIPGTCAAGRAGFALTLSYDDETREFLRKWKDSRDIRLGLTRLSLISSTSSVELYFGLREIVVK